MLSLMKEFGVALVLGLMLGVFASGASADVLGGSGWYASWSSSDVNVQVLNESDTDVTLEITKTLSCPGFNKAPAVTIAFQQIAMDAETVSRIIINSEAITNACTGEYDYWGGFRWILTPSGNVSFNEPASKANGWTGGGLAPLNSTSETWTKDELTIVGGPAILSGTPQGVYTPGTGLVIDVDLKLPYPVFFGFKQVPLPGGELPEPATMAIFLVGAGSLMTKRLRRRT